MPQTINITITSSGPDLGPYNIYLVDDLNNVTLGPNGIPKSLLIPPGYTFTVADNIVKVRLQSVNETCPYVELIIPQLNTCNCSIVTNIDIIDVTIQYTNCYNILVEFTMIPGQTRNICGRGDITATGNINIVNGDACTPTGEGGTYICPPPK